jgi:hypothetical protein
MIHCQEAHGAIGMHHGGEECHAQVAMTLL